MDKPSSNFSGKSFENKADGFDNPTRLPASEEERARWQKANKAWWESTPMRYDWRNSVGYEFGSREYYAEIDRRFLASADEYLPHRGRPFDQLIPYEELPSLDVLEIGIGHGTHAQLLAQTAKSFIGIDLTETAQASTARRFELMGLNGRIMQMDAEVMSFPDASFDFIWSWGVIHHSADTRRVLGEMSRVLRPGGRATVMVYHRNWWNFYVVAGALKGVLQGQLNDKGGLHRVAQGATDGALARYYKSLEWREVTEFFFTMEEIRICGLKNDVIPLPPGRVKNFAERVVPSSVTRGMTNTLRMGSFLIARMRKPAAH
jgi:ubiquinone/menaquinone biosynthesis C-methylase UbiE